MHTCTYGRLEKSPIIAYATWIWRYKKGAVEQTGDKFYTPSESRLVKLRQAVAMVSDKSPDWSKLVATSSAAGYTLCKIDLEKSVVLAWQPRYRGDALFFTRHPLSGATMADIAPLVVETPHAQYDHTLNQALYVFSETKARALILSSSHRCAKSLANKCTGNDGEPIRSNCAGRSAYHNSDAAHAVQTTFMAAHEQLSTSFPEAVFASLHATKSEEFVVSDGTSNPLTERGPRVVAELAKRLGAGISDRRVNVCNRMLPEQMDEAPSNVALAQSEEALNICGSTNVQGRHLNGAKDACKARVSKSGAELTASGRFLHIEQPIALVKAASSKSSRPVMSRPLSEALVAAVRAF